MSSSHPVRFNAHLDTKLSQLSHRRVSPGAES